MLVPRMKALRQINDRALKLSPTGIASLWQKAAPHKVLHPPRAAKIMAHFGDEREGWLEARHAGKHFALGRTGNHGDRDGTC